MENFDSKKCIDLIETVICQKQITKYNKQMNVSCEEQNYDKAVEYFTNNVVLTRDGFCHMEEGQLICDEMKSFEKTYMTCFPSELKDRLKPHLYPYKIVAEYDNDKVIDKEKRTINIVQKSKS